MEVGLDYLDIDGMINMNTLDKAIRSCDVNIEALANSFRKYYNGSVTENILSKMDKNELRTLEFNLKFIEKENGNKPHHVIHASQESINRILKKYDII